MEKKAIHLNSKKGVVTGVSIRIEANRVHRNKEKVRKYSPHCTKGFDSLTGEGRVRVN